MRAFSAIIILSAALAIMVGIILQYVSSSRHESNLLNEIVQKVLEIKQMDTLLNEQALQAASFKLVHFDETVVNTQNLNDTLEYLKDRVSGVRETGKFNLANQVSALIGTIDYRVETMERLKSRVALARNSGNYLLTTLYADVSDFEEQFKILALQTLNEIQGYKIFPTQDQRDTAKRFLKQLKEVSARERLGPSFGLLIKHMDVTFEATSDITELLESMFSQTSQQQISLVLSDLRHIESLRRQQATFLIVMLMGIAGLIFVGLGFAIVRWNQARAEAFKASRLISDALESLNEGFAFFDSQNKLVFWNSTFRDMYATFKDRLKGGMTITEFRQVKEEVGFTKRTIEHEDGTRLEKTRDGRWLLCSNRSIPSGGRALVRVDLTKQREAEQQLEFAGEIFRSANEAMMITDENDKISMVNPAFTQITGFEEEEVLGKTPQILNSGLHNKEFFAEMFQSLKDTGSWSGEIWNRRKNGEAYAEWLSITTVYADQTNAPVRRICLFTDITKLKKSEERLHYQANYDTVTNLPNRNMFCDVLVDSIKKAKNDSKRLAVLSIDLDNFGQINETMGHSIGDKMLRSVAERLEHFFSSTDVIARFSGDQFLVLLHEAERNLLIEHKLVGLLEDFSKPFDLYGSPVYSSASIGVTLYPDDATTVDGLLQHGDAAMFKAKELGGNTYCFFQQEMNQRAQERHAIETSLHKALAQDHFVLFYQPIVDPMTGATVSTEALVRWQDPEKGLIPPGQFIPIAEASGLIVPLGEWILKQACRDAADWYYKHDYNLGVSVNLSSRQFQRGDVYEMVRDVLEETGLPPQKLNLEITESLLVEDESNILEVLRKIRDLGVLLSIDDFGTGYSSLSYLKKFPLTTLKIDRSFINGVLTSSEDAALTEAIISIAQSLNLKVVAEGVESEAQVQFLKDKHCDLIQGFHYSKPLARDSLFENFSKGNLKL